MQFNLGKELKKLIGARGPEIIDAMAVASHPLAWRMRVKFDTKLPPHELVTQDIRFHNPQWGDAETFKSPIESIEFFLPVKYKVVLAGMELYNFYIEVLGDISGGGKAQIESFWFCGKLPQVNTVKTWNVGKGKVIVNDVEFGKEYYGTTARGWRGGVATKHPISTVLRID